VKYPLEFVLSNPCSARPSAPPLAVTMLPNEQRARYTRELRRLAKRKRGTTLMRLGLRATLS